jgi:WD40 repeat protein
MQQATKTFRVFVSSTFGDMREERRILQEKVFPDLERYCESRGAKFQAIDLRWGVSEEAQLDNKTMDICLGEIRRCLKLSPRPNFLILLGNRYGWQPLPARIPCDEMEAILSHLIHEEKNELLSWYRKDENAIPAEYVLLAREREYKEYRKWSSLEKKLLGILRKGADACQLDEEGRIKYFTSATHQEIIHGALSPRDDYPGQEEHVFACLRTIPNLGENESMRDFVEIEEGKFDSYCQSALSSLRSKIEEKLPLSNIHRYHGTLNNSENGQIQLVIDDDELFASAVYDHFSVVIDQEIERVVILDPLEKEINLHREFRDNLLTYFRGRENTLKAIHDFISNKKRKILWKFCGTLLTHFRWRKNVLKAIHDFISQKEGKILCLLGQSGSGKSSVMAKATTETKSQYLTLYRFCGISPNSSTIRSIIYSLTEEIAQHCQIPMENLQKEEKSEENKDGRGMREKFLIDITEDAGLKKVFLKALNIATEVKPIVVFIDALDQLKDPLTIALDWLPRAIPDHCRIILSVLKESEDKIGQRFIKELLPAMTMDAGEMILKGWLGSAQRTLQKEQKIAILKKFEENGLPLYLRLVFEEAKSLRSFDGVPKLKPDVKAVLEDYFEKLQKEHGRLLVKRFCGYLLSGKDRGLSEGEILDLLALDNEYWNDFYNSSHPLHRRELEQIRKLPVAVWSRLYLDLEPYLTTREGKGGNILTFYHRQFTEYAQEQYLTDKKKLHTAIADYFKTLPLFFDEAWKQPNSRKCAEQPYQQMESEQWEDLTNESLGSFPFVMAKIMAELLEGLLDDYSMAFNVIPKDEEEKLKLWNAFFRERSHILRRGNPEWPSYKILLHLAMEHAADSPVTIGAEKLLDEGKCDWGWLCRIQRIAHAGKNPCFAVLEGHTSKVEGALETKDSRFLSWSWDHTLRLWDREGKPLAVLEGHKQAVIGALETKDGHFLSWSDDKILERWDREGGSLAMLKGHKDEVSGALETKDGHFLSWSDDKTLRLWDREGKPLAVLEGHKQEVIGAFETKDSRFLSWSWDHTLRLWDREGKPLAVFEGHTGRVRDALETKDGYFLSWSDDNTLRLWDREGGSLAILKGHKYWVSGALETKDGHFLSWSDDKTLRLWDREGKPLAVLEGHKQAVIGALETKDSRFLSWSWDHTLRLWDREGKPLAVLEGHKQEVIGAFETKDGHFLSWSDEKTLRIWDRGGKPIAALEGHTADVGSVLETKEGRFLSWSDDQTLRIWDREGKPIATLEGHTDDVSSVLETKEGRILSWSSDEKRPPRLWDRTGRSLTVFEGDEEAVLGVLETKDGHFLSWSDNSETLNLWDGEGRSLTVLEGHEDIVIGALETKDGRFLTWSGSRHRSMDNSLRIWGSDGKPLAILEGHTQPVRCTIETRDGRFLSWSDDSIRFWDQTGNPVAIIQGVIDIDSLIELGTLFAYKCILKSFICLLLSKKFRDLTRHICSLERVIETKDGRFLSWGSNTVILWDRAVKPLIVFKGHSNSIVGALETKDGCFLAWSWDGTLRLWDREGRYVDACTIDDGLHRYPELRIAYGGKENNVSRSLFCSVVNSGCLTIFDSAETIRLFWHGDSYCRAAHLKSDGLALLTQVNGQVCFLRIYHGNKQITVKELEEMYDLEYRDKRN